jgi:hypothetical protein
MIAETLAEDGQARPVAQPPRQRIGETGKTPPPTQGTKTGNSKKRAKPEPGIE